MTEGFWTSAKLRCREISIPVMIAMLLVFSIAFFGKNHYPMDAQGSLLQSQSLIETGSIKLDKYSPEGYKFKKAENRHSYYYFPLGTSLYAAPAVFVANLFGLDMAKQNDEAALLRFLAALTCMLMFLVLYKIAKLFVSERRALLFGLIFFLGSTLVSTMGDTLWSINLSVLFSACALFLILRKELRKQSFSPGVLAFLLFSAYLCRPTASLLIVLLSAYVLFKCREMLLRYILWFGLFGALFVCFSYVEYHTYLPSYYSSGRLSLTDGFGLALYGNLFSPSRGFLVFNPFAILALLSILFVLGRMVKNLLFILMLLWVVGQIIIVSMFHNWWGGHSFGPRLLTEMVTPLAIVTLFIHQAIAQYRGDILKKAFISLFVILGILGAYINSYQGLYNPSCYQWNVNPEVDEFPLSIFDWKCSQITADANMLQYKTKKYRSFDQSVRENDLQLLFDGKNEQSQQVRAGQDISISTSYTGASPEKINGDVYIKLMRDPIFNVYYLRENGELLSYRMPVAECQLSSPKTYCALPTAKLSPGKYEVTVFVVPYDLGRPVLQGSPSILNVLPQTNDMIYQTTLDMSRDTFRIKEKMEFAIRNQGSEERDKKAYDIYLTIFIPDKDLRFTCIKPDLALEDENLTCAYGKNIVPVSGEQKCEIAIPDKWASGKYRLYLFYVRPGADPMNKSNWIYNIFTEFNVVR